MGLYSLWLIIVSTVQTNQNIVFCSFFCLRHTFPAVILYLFPFSARSYIVPDQEKKYFCVYIWLPLKSVLSNFIGRFDGISPVN